MNRMNLINYGTYALMLNAQVSKISKRIIHIKKIKDNVIVSCREPFEVRDYDKLLNRDHQTVFDFNYINLMPFALP